MVLKSTLQSIKNSKKLITSKIICLKSNCYTNRKIITKMSNAALEIPKALLIRSLKNYTQLKPKIIVQRAMNFFKMVSKLKINKMSIIRVTL